MKKYVPQNLMQPEQTISQRSPKPTSPFELERPNSSHQPVVLDELISSIAEKNRNAMRPSASQKAHNQRALSSVLSTIFSS